MANKVTTTDTTNKVVITPQSSKKLTIDSGNGNNLTLNQSTPNNVQIINNDVDTSLTPNNVSISPIDNNVSLSSTSTSITVNQSSTSVVTVNTVGPQGPKGDSGADGDTLVSNELEDLRSFTGSIQTEVNSLTAATSSYLTSVPDGTISSSAQIIINESQISDLSHTDISLLNTFTGSIQTEVDNLTTTTSSYALATNISGAFTESSGGFSTRITTLETNNTGTNTGDQDLSPYALIANISGAFNEPSGGFSTRVTTLETAGYITESTDISPLNTFTGSIQTEVDNLTAATSSYITESTNISALNTFTGSIQTEVDNLTAATSSYITESTDILALNTFTGSIQTEVDNLTVATSSYALTSSISGAFAEPSGGFSTRITTLETNNTGTNTGDQDLSPYALTSSISGAFAEASSSFSSRVTTLEGNNFTPNLSTDIEARNITASSNIQIANDIELSPQSKIFVGTSTTEIVANGDDYWIIRANGTRVADFKSNGVVFNEEGSQAADFRIESNTKSHLFFVDSGENKISIGTNTVSDSILTVEGNISASGNFIGNNITASGNVDIQGTLSLGGFTNVSASLAAAVAGGDDLGNHTAIINLNMGGNDIINVGNVDGVDVSTLKNDFNTFTSSIQTEVNNLTSLTSSYLTDPITTSSITDFNTEVSRSAAAAGFGTGGGGEFTPSLSTDIEARNITASANISASGNLIVNSITSSLLGTSSYSTRTEYIEATSFNGNSNYYVPFIQDAGLDIGSSYYLLRYDNTNGITYNPNQGKLIVNDTLSLGDITNVSSSLATVITNFNTLESKTLISESSQINITTSSIIDFPTEVSRSAAAAGFGTGGGTPTDISALNTFTSSIQTEVDNLTVATSSYALTSSISGAFAEPSGGFSTRITTLETAGYITESTDISLLNTFTGSIQTEVDNLTAATSSYITDASDFTTSDNFNVGDITSTALFINPTSQNAEIILDAYTSNFASQIKFSALNVNKWVLGMDPINPQDFRIIQSSTGILNNANGIYITGSTGYIGLGTGTPYERLTVEGNVSASGIVYGSTGSFSHLEGNSPITVKDVITFQNNATFAGSKLTTADIDITGGSFKLGASTFTSSSLAAAIGGGGDNLGNHTADTHLNMKNYNIISASSITAVSLTGSISTSSIEDFNDSVNSLAQTVFDNRDLDSIDALNTFTGSIQTEVDNLTAETGSYLTSPIATSSITDFNTEVSRSAAAAGFGTGGEGGFTPSLLTDIEARNITASNDISSSGVLRVSKVILPQNGQVEYNSSNYFKFGVTNVSIKTAVANYDISNRINFFGGANVGINPPINSTTAPEKLTVGGNISASGNFIGSGLILAGGNGVFTSASLAAAQAGSDNLGNHTASLDLNMSTFDITNVGSITATSLTGSISTSSIENFPTEVSRSAAAAGFGTGGEGTPTDISALNIFTGSIQTEVNNLTAATSSYLTDPITTSSITDFNTEVSRSAAAAGFGIGGEGTPTDISSLNTFTGSIQTEVDNLTAITGSYALTSSISGAFAEPSGGFSTRITTLETAGYFIPGVTVGNNLSAYNILANDILAVGNITASGELNIGGGTFTSASLAAAQAGADNLGNHTAITTLNLDNNNIISASNIEATSISINGLGVPTVISNSNINLSASNAVVINSSPLRLSAYTNNETGSGFSAGDVYFNTDTSKFMGYNGSNHVELG